MTERNPPVWMQSGTYQASDDRMITGLLSSRSFSANGTTNRIDGGVVPGYDQLRVVANGSNMQVIVNGGVVVISNEPPGAYICQNEGPTVLTHDIEGSSNPRTDLIVAEVSDPTVVGPESAGSWSLKIIKGNPGPSAESPSLSSRYQLALAQVRVIPASLNGNTNKITQAQITDARYFNTAQGGTHIKWAGGPFPVPSPGRMCFDVSEGKLYINKTGTTGGWTELYDQNAWKSVLSALRPRQTTSGQTATVKALYVDAQENWNHVPGKGDTNENIDVVNRTDIVTPSGILKFSIGAFGRVAEGASSGHMSVEILNGSNVVWKPRFTTGVSFYSKEWSQSGMSFMASGLPESKSLTVRLVFCRQSTKTGSDAAGTAYFRNMLLMVEPVI